MVEIKSKLPIVIAGTVLTAAAFVAVPPIINKVARKIYRSKSDTSDIDFDNLGPEIVRKDQDEHGEE